jgi:hypothetical protein
MHDHEIRIKFLDQFIDYLYNTAVQKGAFCFRGHRNQDWILEPSLRRVAKSKIKANQLQSALFRELLLDPKRIPYLRSRDPIEYLILLQHFGIPTKLLDVTMDPLIALFFSCYDPPNEHLDKDGKVYVFPLDQYNRLDMNTSNLDVFRESMTIEKYRELFAERVYNSEHLFLEPLIKNPRMRVQDGAFFMFSTHTLDEKNDIWLSMEEYHGAVNRHKIENGGKHRMWFSHFLIDKRYKESILQELDQLYNINGTIVFAENDFMDSVKDFYRDLYTRSMEHFNNVLRQKMEMNRAR